MTTQNQSQVQKTLYMATTTILLNWVLVVLLPTFLFLLVFGSEVAKLTALM